MLSDSRASDTGQFPEVEVTDHRVAGAKAGVEIHVRNKRLRSLETPAHDKVVVFVHGATYPGSVAFDHAMFGGGSWMDYLALHGFDSYLFDVRGYGRSSRPSFEATGDAVRRPYARTPEALEDLGAVVDFVRRRANVAKVNLIGWSWGTAVGGGFTSEHSDFVRHLVMVAPLWTIHTWPGVEMSRLMMSSLPWPANGHPDYFGPYRSVSKAETRQRWVRGLEPDVAEELMPQAEFEVWWKALLAIQEGRGSGRGSVEAPNGVMADLFELWSAARPTYVPERIAVPTQLLLGEWDVDTPLYMAQKLFSKLNGAPYKRLEILGRGTHSMPLELNRVDLYRRTREFLEARFI